MKNRTVYIVLLAVFTVGAVSFFSINTSPGTYKVEDTNSTLELYLLQPDQDLSSLELVTFGSLQMAVPFTPVLEELSNGLQVLNPNGGMVWFMELDTGTFLPMLGELGTPPEQQADICHYLSRAIDFDACADDYYITKGIIEANKVDLATISNKEEREAVELLKIIYLTSFLDEYSRFEHNNVRGFISYGLQDSVSVLLFISEREAYEIIISPDDRGYVDFILDSVEQDE